MRCLALTEVWDWCREHRVPLTDDDLPADAAPEDRRVRRYASGARSGDEPALAAACVAALGEWDECLLWVTLWGVWESSEDWPAWYAARGDRGERRSLGAAPGHLFTPAEDRALAEFLSMVMENGWDAYVIPATRGRAASTRVRVSHDEWVAIERVRTADPAPSATA